MSKLRNAIGGKCVAATIAAATAVSLIVGAAGHFAGAEDLGVVRETDDYTIQRDENDGSIKVVRRDQGQEAPLADEPMPTTSDIEVESQQPEADVQPESDAQTDTDGQSEGDGEGRRPIVGPKIGQPEGDDEGRRPISGPKIGLPSDADNITYTNADGTIATRARAAFECDLGTFECEDARLNSAWYYVSRSNTIEHRIDVAGDATIVLCPEATLTCPQGIHVPWGSSLTIYSLNGQDGSLVADASDVDNAAGIGGNEDESNGPITICGGHVTANGGKNGAGIGGGDEGHGNGVTIYGGTIEANAGEDGAGIGGGCRATGGPITIYGGTVTAWGNEYGAGIGGGYKGNGGTITIYGGTVDAHGDHCFGLTYNGSGAGIGGGDCADGGSISILGGTVNGDANGAAGIGGGKEGSGGTIVIKHAKVTAAQRPKANNKDSAGIGSGYKGDSCGSITIEDSIVEATSDDGAGIGSGRDCDAGGTIVIRDSVITATSNNGAGIGGGLDSAGRDVTISGECTIDATSAYGAAIGRGACGPDDNPGQVHLDGNHKVTCYDEGYKLAPAAEREGYCKYRNHVKVEPCEHRTGSYEKHGEHHLMHCYACCECIEQDHDFKEDGSCRACHYVKPAPVFGEVTLGYADRLHLNFPVAVPKEFAERFEDAYCELSIGGNNHRTIRERLVDAGSDGHGHKIFQFDITPIEMGQQVSAVFHYDGDEGRIDAWGDTKGLLARDAKRTDDQGLAGRARRVANLGHYLQCYLAEANGWEVGHDYAKMDLFFEDELDVAGAMAGLGRHAAKADVKGARIKGVGMNVTFGATATIDLSLTPKQGAKLSGKATFGGKEVALKKKSDGTWHARVEGVRVANFDEPLVVEGECGGAFSVEASVLSYAAHVGADKNASGTAKQAMAAVWQLYSA